MIKKGSNNTDEKGDDGGRAMTMMTIMANEQAIFYNSAIGVNRSRNSKSSRPILVKLFALSSGSNWYFTYLMMMH
jgi:hypothetical protein